MTTVCNAPECGKSLPPSKGSRPRLYCDSTCRRKAYDARKAAPAGAASVPVEPLDTTLADVVKRDLEAAGRLETVPGQLAFALARRLDAPGTTASSVASLSKELRALLAEALAGVKKSGDPVDEARAVRDYKLRAVG